MYVHTCNVPFHFARPSGVDKGGCFGRSSTPFVPEAIGLVYCTVHQVYILPEDSADSGHPCLSLDSDVSTIIAEREQVNQMVLKGVFSRTLKCACIHSTHFVI